jgi:hypothetical protein
MKYLMYLLLLSLVSCVNLQNICKTSEQLNGEVIYAIPTRNHTRLVYLDTPEGVVKIYLVPIEQPLTNIPVCKHKGKYYWVMP